MNEILSKFDSQDLIVAGTFCGLALFAILCGAGHYWHLVRESDNATKLKLDMLDRGMSADEIKTVLEAGRPTPEPAVRWRRRWRC